MLTISFVIIALLITALVLLILGFVLAPRTTLWVAAAICAVLALCLKVFGVGA
jgi:quinol-cytochrome oxidoreductase complex cytochrome b subunit